MPLIAATQLRVGMVIMHQNDLWRVMQVVHVTPGNWRGMVQTKLRNLRAGTQTEHRFRSEDKPERVTLEQHEMEFLYESDGLYHFMNTESFEQVGLDRDLLGDAVNSRSCSATWSIPPSCHRSLIPKSTVMWSGRINGSVLKSSNGMMDTLRSS